MMRVRAARRDHPALTSDPGRQLRQRRQTRARLVAAGRRVIAAHGVDRAAVAAITDDADVGVGSF